MDFTTSGLGNGLPGMLGLNYNVPSTIPYIRDYWNRPLTSEVMGNYNNNYPVLYGNGQFKTTPLTTGDIVTKSPSKIGEWWNNNGQTVMSLAGMIPNAPMGKDQYGNVRWRNGMFDVADPLHWMADGRESKAGNFLNDAGVQAFKVGAQSGNGWVMLGGAIAKGAGDVLNWANGVKKNKNLMNALNKNIDNARFIGSVAGKPVNDSNTAINLAGQASTNIGFTRGELTPSVGWTGHAKNKSKRIYRGYQNRQNSALQYQNHAIVDMFHNVDRTTDDIANMNSMKNNVGTYGTSYAGGGFLNMGNTGMGAIDYGLNMDFIDHLNNKDKALNKVGNMPSMAGTLFNPFALGGVMQSHGSDWSTGARHINAGGSHESNPNQGVPMGVDNEGNPNVVEEGEVIVNDYVFSDRIDADGDTKKMFHIGKKRKITFADLAKKLEREVAERPNDPISKASFNRQIAKLEEQQERQKAEAEEAQAKVDFDKMSPEEKQALMQQLMAEQQAQQQQPSEEEAMAQQQMAAAQGMPLEMQGGVPPEAMMQQQMMAPQMQQMAAYGGKLNKFDDGGPVKGSYEERRQYYDWLKNRLGITDDTGINSIPEVVFNALYQAYQNPDSPISDWVLQNIDYGDNNTLLDKTLNSLSDAELRELYSNIVNNNSNSKAAWDTLMAMNTVPSVANTGNVVNNPFVANTPVVNNIPNNIANNTTTVNYGTLPEQFAAAKAAEEEAFNKAMGISQSTIQQAPISNPSSSTPSMVVSNTSPNSNVDYSKLWENIYRNLDANIYGSEGFRDWANKNNVTYDENDPYSVLRDKSFLDYIKKNNPSLADVLGHGYDFDFRQLDDTDDVVNLDTSGSWGNGSWSDWYNNGDQSSWDAAFKELYDNELWKNHKDWNITDPSQLTRDQIGQLMMETKNYQDTTNALKDNKDLVVKYLRAIRKGGNHISQKAKEWANQFFDENDNLKEEYASMSAADFYNIAMHNVRSTNAGNYWKTLKPQYLNNITKNYFQNPDGTWQLMSYVPEGWKASNSYSWNGDEGRMTYNYYMNPKDAKKEGDLKKTEADKFKNVVPRLRSEAARYVGLFGPAVGLGLWAAGVGKPDFSDLNAAIERSGKAHLAGYQPIAASYKYTPQDTFFPGIQNAGIYAAANRNIMNTSAPRGTTNAGLVNSAYNAAVNSGDLATKVAAANDDARQKKAAFDLGWMGANSQAYNATSQFNAAALNDAAKQYTNAALYGAAQKMEANKDWYGSLYGNVNNLFKGISDYGREQADYNLLARLAATGALGAMDKGNPMGSGLFYNVDEEPEINKRRRLGLFTI